MGIFEWFGESYNPGPAGSVEFGNRKRPKRPRYQVMARFTIALVLLGPACYLIFSNVDNANAKAIAIVLGIAYLALGYFVHPAPDTSNLGWFGGLIDHPFRYSDDVNRFLIVLEFFLLPARFVAESIVDFIILVRNNEVRD
ncbi:hypothetical protein L0337_15125 [candidate division KSB1 bacterium]|nr:hypothetical protein [candidate division KSB1 bacterium]